MAARNVPPVPWGPWILVSRSGVVMRHQSLQEARINGREHGLDARPEYQPGLRPDEPCPHCHRILGEPGIP